MIKYIDLGARMCALGAGLVLPLPSYRGCHSADKEPGNPSLHATLGMYLSECAFLASSPLPLRPLPYTYRTLAMFSSYSRVCVEAP